jgi:integrase
MRVWVFWTRSQEAWWSRAIRAITRGPWAHCGIGFDDIYYEAIVGEGVRGPVPLAKLASFGQRPGNAVLCIDVPMSPEDAVTALRAVMPAMLRDIYDLAVLTCMRRGEFVRLEWRDVDQEKRLLTIRDRKHPRQREGHTDVIPLLGNALEILTRQERGDGPIFPVSPEWISDQFLLACRIARIEDLHFHDLRHEAVSRLFEMGYTIEQVALVSGHRSWSMLKRYTNLRPEQFHAIDPGKPRDPPRHKTDDLRPGTSGA